jgi:hypothetical protein
MSCWHCDQPAHGARQFFGHCVCKDHAQSLPPLSRSTTTRRGCRRRWLWPMPCTVASANPGRTLSSFEN